MDLTNRHLFEAFIAAGISSNSNAVLAGGNVVKENLNLKEEKEEISKYVKKVHKLCKSRWMSKTVKRYKKKMEEKHKTWLDSKLNIPKKASLTMKWKLKASSLWEDHPYHLNLRLLQRREKEFKS